MPVRTRIYRLKFSVLLQLSPYLHDRFFWDRSSAIEREFCGSIQPPTRDYGQRGPGSILFRSRIGTSFVSVKSAFHSGLIKTCICHMPTRIILF